MKEVRFSIPFVGGPTVIFTKEEVMAQKDKMTKLLHDKDFQRAVYMALGKTVAVAIALVGINLVWKWWIAYVALSKLGVVITTATWLKWGAGAVVLGGGVYFAHEEVSKLSAWQAAALASKGENKADVVIDAVPCPACGGPRSNGVCEAHGRR